MPASTLPALGAPDPVAVTDLLSRVAALHHHLCPRQVLGVRMGIAGAALVGVPVPQTDKRLLVVMETDGCGADGVSVATNCWVGRRTMRVEDYGKMAATFVDTETTVAWRVYPHPGARAAAEATAPDVDRWRAMLEAYKTMPAEALLTWQPVALATPPERFLSSPGLRVACARCGEEVMNGREVQSGDEALCAPCAGAAAYYTNDPGG